MKTKRIEYISLASVVSIIAVVYIHSNMTILDFSPSPYWFVADLIQSIFVYAVPVFFMISGAMLVDFPDRYDLKTYFKKRVNKTVVPYVFWIIFGLIVQIYLFKMIDISDINLSYFIDGTVHSSFINVYWFFIPLFVLYLVLPLFSFIRNNTKQLIACILALFALNFYTNIDFMGYIAIALTGYCIHKKDLSRNLRILFYILGLFGFSACLFGTYYMSLSMGVFYGNLIGYTNLPCILYSIGLFIFIKHDLVRIIEFSLVEKVVLLLDDYTFAIYLIHWYIIQSLIGIFTIDISSIPFRLFGPICVILICVLLIKILRRIPIVERILPH